jgi:hypothetical protein
MDGRLDAVLLGHDYGDQIMKTKTSIYHIFIAAAFLVLAGCTPANAITPQPSETSAPSLPPSPSPNSTLKPTSTWPPRPTPHPTLRPEKALQLLAALQDETCKLPCYLGIIPGQTTLQDAKAILVELGGSGLGEYRRDTDGLLSYTYTLDVGEQSPGEKIISNLVTLVPKDDVVQVVIMGAGSMPSDSSPISIETYRTYWQRYSARQIFLQLGEPEKLSVNRVERLYDRGADLIFLYSKQNIAIDLYGTGQENNLCPKNEAKSLSLHMLISYPGSPLNIYDLDGGVPLTDQELYPPIEDVFGVDGKNFYNSVVSDPSVCFTPK